MPSILIRNVDDDIHRALKNIGLAVGATLEQTCRHALVDFVTRRPNLVIMGREMLEKQQRIRQKAGKR